MKRMKEKKRLLIGTLLVVTLLCTAIYLYSSKSSASSGQLKVSYIDIGQGDSFLLESDGKYLLIDGGPVASGPILVEYLKSRGVKRLDYVISTHPHSDHAGGLTDVVNHFDISVLYKTNAIYENTNYDRFLNAVKEKNVFTVSPIAGTHFMLGSAKVVFLSPANDVSTYEVLNDTSIVVKVINGENSFLFTGDAEKVAEDEMRASGYDITADVLKVGHHSALTSTSQAFLDAVNPSISIISCGKNNNSGFPRLTTLNKLRYTNIYRTDLSGTITLFSDGKRITADCEPASYAITSTKKLYPHLKDLSAIGSLGNITLLNIKDDQDFDTTFNEPFEITFDADYGLSAMGSIQYLLLDASDNFDFTTEEWKTLSGNRLVLSDDFYGCVYVKFKNQFGNEEIRMTNGFCLDQMAPTNCQVTSNLEGMSLLQSKGSDKITLTTENKVILQFSAEYGISNKESVEYMIVEKDQVFSVNDPWKRGDKVTISGAFAGRVYVRFTDQAGNSTIMKTIGFEIKPKEEASDSKDKDKDKESSKGTNEDGSSDSVDDSLED